MYDPAMYSHHASQYYLGCVWKALLLIYSCLKSDACRLTPPLHMVWPVLCSLVTETTLRRHWACSDSRQVTSTSMTSPLVQLLDSNRLEEPEHQVRKIFYDFSQYLSRVCERLYDLSLSLSLSLFLSLSRHQWQGWGRFVLAKVGVTSLHQGDICTVHQLELSQCGQGVGNKAAKNSRNISIRFVLLQHYYVSGVLWYLFMS